MGVNQCEFKERLSKTINDVLEARRFAKEHNLLNTEEYLAFEDILNVISTMDPEA